MRFLCLISNKYVYVSAYVGVYVRTCVRACVCTCVLFYFVFHINEGRALPKKTMDYFYRCYRQNNPDYWQCYSVVHHATGCCVSSNYNRPVCQDATIDGPFQ